MLSGTHRRASIACGPSDSRAGTDSTARTGAGNLIDFYATDYPGGDERYTVRGGNDQVPTRIVEELPDGTVTLDAALESVRSVGDTVELRFGGMAAPVVADRVILAVPFTTLRHVDLDDSGFSVPMLAAIDELGMGTNAKVLLQFDRPFYTGFGDWSGGMNRRDEPIFGTWESGATDGAEGLGLLTVYSGGRVGASYDAGEPHAPAGQGVIDETLEAVDQVVPGVAAAFNGRAWLDSWVQDPWVAGPTPHSTRVSSRASGARWASRRAPCTSRGSRRRRTARGSSTAASRAEAERPPRCSRRSTSRCRPGSSGRTASRVGSGPSFGGRSERQSRDGSLG